MRLGSGSCEKATSRLCSPSRTLGTPEKPIWTIVAAVTPLRAPMPAKSKAFSTCSSSPTQAQRPETCWAA